MVAGCGFLSQAFREGNVSRRKKVVGGILAASSSRRSRDASERGHECPLHFVFDLKTRSFRCGKMGSSRKMGSRVVSCIDSGIARALIADPFAGGALVAHLRPSLGLPGFASSTVPSASETARAPQGGEARILREA